ncbi:MAG: hypothetical protein ACM30I_00910 [Gemmatimonas sp.]
MLRASVRVLIALSLPVALGASSCPPPAPDVIASSLGPGWNCLAAPTAFDGPGSIFRVDPRGAKYTVGDYGARAGIVTSPFANLTATQTVKVNAGIVAQILRIGLGVNAGAHRDYTVTQTFGGAKALNTTDDGVQQILDDFAKRRDIRANNRYYLVRGAVAATRVTYDFDSDIAADFGADVAIKVAHVTPSATYSNREGFRYDSSFEPPVYTCVLAEELSPETRTALTGAAPASPEPAARPAADSDGGFVMTSHTESPAAASRPTAAPNGRDHAVYTSTTAPPPPPATVSDAPTRAETPFHDDKVLFRSVGGREE